MIGRGIAGHRLGLQSRELGEGSGELAVISGVVAKQEVGGRGGIAGAAERRDRADAGRSNGLILQSDVAIHGGFLHAPDAQLTPARDGHGFGQHELGEGAGAVFIDQRGEEIEEAFRGFLFKYDSAGEEFVADAGSVGAGGLDLFVRGHGLFRKHFGRE